MNTNIREKILSSIRAAYPELPVDVQASPEDDEILCVMVFSVPDELAKSIRDFIYDLSDAKIAGENLLLLPMIVDCATTSKYYSKQICLEFCAVLKNNEWQSTNTESASSYANAEYALAA